MATFINGHLHIDLSRAPPYNASTIPCKEDAPLSPITTTSINQSNKNFRSACNAVLSTTELLELILLQLPIIDILTCTQTCKFLLNLIESSKAIRIHLLRPDTAMYAIPSYGKFVNVPNTWLHRTSLAAGNVKRTHFIMDVDRGKMVVYDSGRGSKDAPAFYVLIPDAGDFVKVLSEGKMELRIGDYSASVYWKDKEGDVVCCTSFRGVDAYSGRRTCVKNDREGPDWVIRDYFLELQERREGVKMGSDKEVLSGRHESGNIQATRSKRKKIVRALLKYAVRAKEIE